MVNSTQRTLCQNNNIIYCRVIQIVHPISLRSPNPTTCHYYFWVYVNDTVYIPPLSSTLNELKSRITAAIESIAKYMGKVWDEFDYQLDVIRVT